MSEVASVALAVKWTPQQHMRDRERHTAAGALRPVLAAERVLVHHVITNAQQAHPTDSNLFMSFSTETGWLRLLFQFSFVCVCGGGGIPINNNTCQAAVTKGVQIKTLNDVTVQHSAPHTTLTIHYRK